MQIEERDPGRFTFGLAMTVGLVVIGTVALVLVLRTPTVPVPQAQQVPLLSTEEAPFDYDLWAKVLQKRVDEHGMVDYTGVKADPVDLDAFLALIEKHSPNNNIAVFTSEDEALTYWINAYNAWCMKIVADNYPVDSIMDIGDTRGAAFDMKVCNIGGDKMSLNDIEQGAVRVQFVEPRAHFALNCASLGCPPLPREPFLPGKLDAQLEAAAKGFFSRRWYLRILGNGHVGVSSILDWYGSDFIKWLKQEGKKPEVAEYLKLYAPDAIREALIDGAKIEFVDYDWRLTDQAAEWSSVDRS